MKFLHYLFLLILFVYACSNAPEQTNEPSPTYSLEVTSLLGKTLLPPKDSEAGFIKKDSLLKIAKANFKADSNNLNNIIWLGRRTAYLWRYHEAIAIYTSGLEKHPNSPELYRHRGHRYISTRQLDKAIADFEKAAKLAENRSLEIEPDGLANKLNIPLSNLHFNIYYHLGLAHYLKGDFENAANVYKKCMTWSDNPDLKVATADWLYMTYQRLGQTGQADSLLAAIPTDWELVENDGYYNRIFLYKGLKNPEDLLDFSKTELDNQLNLVTQGYGVGNWHLYRGDTTTAFSIFDKILETDYWSAFGYIAAEAEVAKNL